jgi:hypothetical protein
VLTRVSVAQTLLAESSAEALSSTFHRRLLRLLSRRATIDSMQPFAIIAAAGVVLLAAASGGSSSRQIAQLGSTTTALAFSRCMRSHGVPNFPDPNPQGNFPPFSPSVSKQTSTVADGACEHLLPSAGVAGTRGDQEKLAFGLRSARCMRSHGYPTYPDPPNANASSQGSGTRFEGTGIDTKSPRFQTTETACEHQTRKALGLS